MTPSLRSPQANESVRITFPWPLLVSDNAKYGVAKGRMILTARYREAKDVARMVAQGAVKGDPLTGAVSIRVVLYEPARNYARDLSNYCKLVHDALSGVAYEDDSQIDAVTWVRGPVDPALPRCEIQITSLPQES